VDHRTEPVEVPIDRIRQPLLRIIHLENISGIALIAGAVTALILANTPLGESVDHFWHHHLEVVVGPFHLDESLVHWVNDGLMTLFFFVAGLEIKRELVVGDLREPRKAALPAIAALGGMVVPALVYVALAGAETRNGWGIPMATDIAFAVGVLTLLGNRVPSRLKVFLLTLAIVDDLGAIVVIAVFYTTSLNTTALAAAGAILALMVALRLLGVWWMPVYALAGMALWFAVFESGVHATLAGVACGLLAPARPRRPAQTEVVANENHTIDDLKAIIFDTRETKSVVDRLIHGLHPFVALAIVPVFAMANTGVAFTPASLVDALTSSTGLAVMFGLVLGKPIGIVLASLVAVKSRLAVLPSGVSWSHMVGVGFLAGIGFTVSLFITELAFAEADEIVDNSKIAVLVASVLASIGGAVLLSRNPVGAGAEGLAPGEAAVPVAVGPDHRGPELGPITYEELNATAPDAYLADESEAGRPQPTP
jgi:NhaA family Na+:H+ antiporter